MHTELLIGNRLEAGQGPANSVVNPRTGQTLINLADATVGQVDAAVNAAAKAFEKWSLTTPVERCTYLLKIADIIEREADAFAELEALNCGKPKHLMLRDEIPAIADCFRFFAGAVRCMHGPLAGEYLAGHTSMIRRDPLGVIASIAPWNYPLMMGAWKLAPIING
jgi:aminobutyraldehyde dehydrogenase